MNKTQKMKQAANKARKQNAKNVCKKIILFPLNVCKAIWNWVKSIDVVGMINLTLLVAIIVLFSALIIDVSRCGKSSSLKQETQQIVVNNDNAKVIVAANTNNKNVVLGNNKLQTKTNAVKSKNVKDTRRVVKRKVKTTLPLRPDEKTGITPKIKVVGVEKPVVVAVATLPAKDLPKQNLYGDVIVDFYPDSPILSNGVNVNGNLFIQNMHKYTLPCDAKIEGHLFIRNVHRLNFCGAFTVKGNIYVNRESSFGPIPSNARVGGQVML